LTSSQANNNLDGFPIVCSRRRRRSSSDAPVNRAEDTRVDISGSFWVAGSTGPRRPGVLTAEPTLATSLVVQGALTAMTRRQPAADDAAGTLHVFEPSDDVSLRTVHGLADDGTPLTLLDAQNRRYDGFFPDDQVETLAGTHAVIGTHLAGRAHPFTAARARLQGLQALLPAEPGGPARAATRLAGPGLSWTARRRHLCA
jgi:hypothetical protein